MSLGNKTTHAASARVFVLRSSSHTACGLGQVAEPEPGARVMAALEVEGTQAPFGGRSDQDR